MERRDFLKTGFAAVAFAGTRLPFSWEEGNSQNKSSFRVSDNKRYLTDASGKPFFIMGDTPWFIQKQKIEDVRLILGDRLKKGYNSLLLELLDDSAIPSVDGYGNHAFVTDTDITKPDQAYWDYTIQIFEECEKLGFFVVVNPIWYGWGGGLWMHHINTANIAVYGEFLGKLFARFRNLMWLNGGDRNPDDRLDACTRVLIDRLRKFAPHHLHTVHNAHEYSSSDFYYNEKWLDVNSGYTYGKSFLHILPEYYRNRPVKPVILCETGYEDEPNDIHSLQDENSGPLWTPYLIRRNVWWAVMSGACGYFAGSRLWRWEENWKETLQVRSAIEAPVVMQLFRSVPWWRLVPDIHHEFVTEGWGGFDDVNYVTAAITPEGNYAVAYMPGASAITIQKNRLNANCISYWFDPINGSVIPAAGKELSSAATLFETPGNNGVGEPDRVLVFADKQTIIRNRNTPDS